MEIVANLFINCKIGIGLQFITRLFCLLDSFGTRLPSEVYRILHQESRTTGATREQSIDIGGTRLIRGRPAEMCRDICNRRRLASKLSGVSSWQVTDAVAVTCKSTLGASAKKSSNSGSKSMTCLRCSERSEFRFLADSSESMLRLSRLAALHDDRPWSGDTLQAPVAALPEGSGTSIVEASATCARCLFWAALAVFEPAEKPDYSHASQNKTKAGLAAVPTPRQRRQTPRSGRAYPHCAPGKAR